jgi:flavin reductase (NADH)/flavin reductase/chlorophenol-4-monooxygenase component 1
MPGSVAGGSIAGACGYEVSRMEFRHAMSLLATSVSLVTTDGPHGRAGLTCSAVCSVTDSPPIVLACVGSLSSANAVIKGNGVLAISCLGAGQQPLAELFAGVGRVPMAQRFEASEWHRLKTGSPCRADTLMALDCRLVSFHEVGTHSVLIAAVEGVRLGPATEPLVYHNRAFATTRPI